jgi:hypothetical protein
VEQFGLKAKLEKEQHFISRSQVMNPQVKTKKYDAIKANSKTGQQIPN